MEEQLQRELWEGICFDGNDTLCLAQFMKRMDEFPECREKCIVHIQGHWVKNDKPANEIGFPVGGHIHGYIRRIIINPISRERRGRAREIDAGGSNATFEDIRATRVSFLFFGIPETWENLVEATDFALHDIRMTKHRTDRQLRTYVDLHNYPCAIAVAKHLRNSRLAAVTLVNYLQHPKRDAETMEKLTDAVRSLENFCQTNKEWSYNATEALLEYISSNIDNRERGNSVIYAIEALGYVAPPNGRAKRRVCESLSELLGGLDRSEYREEDKWWYWHVVWASLVVFTRKTMHSALNIGVIQELKQALDDRETLAEFGSETVQESRKARGVVRKLMSDVITLYRDLKQPLRILHLSDIHLGTQGQAEKYLAELKADLSMGIKLERVDRLDYLVISGDIASKSTKDEYDAAYSFINRLMDNYQLGADRVVIVPGNHDLNWDLSKKAYHQRFKHFNDYLYKKIYGRDYPLKPDYQAELFRQADDRVVFLALNSCWNIDHQFLNRSGIRDDALNNALTELNDAKYNNWLKIAVWHHPVTGEEPMNNKFLEKLAQYGFHVCMHGHIHQAIEGFHYYDPKGRLRFIGAGTFGACVAERPAGVPMQYNLIKYDPDDHSMTVNARRKDSRDSPWGPDYPWDGGKPRYSVEIRFP